MTLLVYKTLLEDFFRKVLVPLEKDEVYIALIVARKKYGASRSEEMLDKLVLKRSDPEYLVRKFQKFCNVENCYLDRNTGEPIPPESMAVYIDLTPRSAMKAYRDFINSVERWSSQLTNLLLNGNLDEAERVLKNFRRLDTKLFSSLAKSPATSPYRIVDIDEKSSALLKKVLGALKEHVVWVTETRGGYHVIVRNNRDTGIIFHEVLRGLDKVELQFGKRLMTPLPGTMQGGFMVNGKMVKL